MTPIEMASVARLDSGTILVGNDVAVQDLIDCWQGANTPRIRLRPVAEPCGARRLAELWLAGIDDVVPMRPPFHGAGLLGPPIVPTEARASPARGTGHSVRVIEALEGSCYSLSLKELAARVDVSPRTQRRRAPVGAASLADVRRTTRSAIRNYLLVAGLPLARIAEVVGYGSAPALVVAVRRETGVPPRQLAAHLAFRALDERQIDPVERAVYLARHPDGGSARYL